MANMRKKSITVASTFISAIEFVKKLEALRSPEELRKI